MSIRQLAVAVLAVPNFLCWVDYDWI